MEPRRWQSEAMDLWRPAKRGVVSVVTGAGKTALALLLFDELRRTVEGLRLVVLVPTVALLDQWYVALATEVALSSKEISTFSGEGRDREPGRASIAVLNTARSHARELRTSDPTLLVVDECHRAGAPENAKALRVGGEYTLGLSATPVREFDDGFERYVQPALGPVIYEYDYVSARRDGVIAPFSIHNFRFPLSQRERAEYGRLTERLRRAEGEGRAEMSSATETLERQRARVLAASPRRTAAAVAVSEQFPGAKLVFHERIDEAERIAGLLDSRGDRVTVYHSRLGAGIRRRNLELFKDGQFSTLVTCRALDEGLNVPDASAAIVAASTRSTRQRIQRLGRVLRIAPGKQAAAVATVYSTNEERAALAAEAAALEDVASVKWYEISI